MQEKQNRQSNYDLLRIFATIAVIIIHANFHFFGDRFETPDLSPEFITENLLNIITRFSVPVFIMLSGGFNLNNPGNGNAVSFYKKTTWKIVLPTIIIAFIFMVIDVTKAIILGTSIIGALVNYIHFPYALWYMVILVMLYFVTPLLVKMKSTISEKHYVILSVILMVYAVCSQAMSTYRVSYTLGTVGAFLGYYLMGDVIMNHLRLKIPMVISLIIMAASIALTWFIRYKGFTFYTNVTYRNFFSPTIVLFSMCMLIFFKNINVKAGLSYPSRLTFYIYLFHSITLNLVYFLIERFVTARVNELILIAAATVSTLLLSLIPATAADHIWLRQTKLKDKWYGAKFWKAI